MSDALSDVYNALQEARSKYVYFKLASAGACIGFAVNQTNNAPLSITQLPLGAAVLLWGFSFFCGCMQLANENATLYFNATLLQVERGVHPITGSNPFLIEAALKELIQKHAKRAGRFGRWQFNALIAGAVCYVAWHVLEMYVRAVGSVPAWLTNLFHQ